MPSILPGYEYDIFISYRQKDNKRDGWVTEFIETLKDEIEATFKRKYPSTLMKILTMDCWKPMM